MESIIGHRIDYEGVWALKGQRHMPIADLNWSKYLSTLGGQPADIQAWYSYKKRDSILISPQLESWQLHENVRFCR